MAKTIKDKILFNNNLCVITVILQNIYINIFIRHIFVIFAVFPRRLNYRNYATLYNIICKSNTNVTTKKIINDKTV